MSLIPKPTFTHDSPTDERSPHARSRRPAAPTAFVVGPRLAAELERAFARRRDGAR